MTRITAPHVKQAASVADASGLERQNSLSRASPDLEHQWRYAVGPINAYALIEQSDGVDSLIAIGKRDGLLMLLDVNGNLIRKTVIPSNIYGLAATGQGDAAQLAVATAQGVYVLDAKLATQATIAIPGCGAVAWLEDNVQRTVVVMTDHGEVAAYAAR